ncbi:YmL10 [Lobulomyces angularis]|nr:YmL10 [Lobulomyces angularis]
MTLLHSWNVLKYKSNFLPSFAKNNYLNHSLKYSTFLHSQNVKDNTGANKKKKRLGRGEGSGKGKTSGRGQKGYHARSNKSRPVPAFEGGQTGIIKAFPQMGQIHNTISLDQLQFWINKKKLNTEKLITVKVLYRNKLVRNVKNGIYLDDRGSKYFTSKINIEVQEATTEAIEKIESLGGKIETKYYSKRELKATLHPGQFAILPTRPQLPQEWKDLRLYVDPHKRGYLAPKEGESLKDVVSRVMRSAKRSSKLQSLSSNH